MSARRGGKHRGEVPPTLGEALKDLMDVDFSALLPAGEAHGAPLTAADLLEVFEQIDRESRKPCQAPVVFLFPADRHVFRPVR